MTRPISSFPPPGSYFPGGFFLGSTIENLPPGLPVLSLDYSRRSVITVAVVFALSACTNLTTAPGSETSSAKKEKKKGETDATPAPAFIFVSDRTGVDQLYRFRNDTIVRLSFGNLSDTHPHAAAGQVVFTSYRDGNAEIYRADTDLKSVKRLTFSATLDDEPSLSSDGARVAFVSLRTGAPRLFVMDSNGEGQRAIETGSASLTPERSPSWSATGDRLAFTSTRTGTSQVFVVASTGGEAIQLTNESGGAFDPEWNEDGTEITYVAFLGGATLRTVTIATGAIRPVITDFAAGQPSCNASACVAVRDAYSSAGDIALVTLSGGSRILVGVAGNDHTPALLK